MLTFTRAGRTTLYVEDQSESGATTNFGTLGFLLPEKTPHLPAQLTLEDSWYWKHQTLGAGWYIFIDQGQTFPDSGTEAQLLDQFIAELRKRLPGVAPKQSSGFAWIVGYVRQPADMSLVRLDLQGTGNKNSGLNPATPTYEQTFTFQQFNITVNRQTEVRLNPDSSGFEILSTLAKPMVHVHVPVAPHVYRAATSVAIPLEGEFRGSLQFTLEPLLPVRFRLA